MPTDNAGKVILEANCANFTMLVQITFINNLLHKIIGLLAP
jgi:hypothetical protein